MQPSHQINQETPATLTVVAWPDPIVEARGHKPGSAYIHGVWLGRLGPATTLAWERLSRIAVACPSTPVDTVDLAVSLGLGENLGRNSAISCTLGRMVAFGAAHRCGDKLAVRRALPDVPDRMLGRLSYTARISHQHLARSTPTPSNHGAPAVDVGL
jgi:hypothetical protein